MPHISMCTDISCKRRFECYRFRARPSESGQSFANFKGCKTKATEYYCDIKAVSSSRLQSEHESQRYAIQILNKMRGNE